MTIMLRSSDTSYVILTSKPGQFRTELVVGLRAVEAYDYVFCGRTYARFVVAELQHPLKFRVVDECAPYTVNEVPSKFLKKFSHIDAARRELQQLSQFGAMDVALVKQENAEKLDAIAARA